MFEDEYGYPTFWGHLFRRHRWHFPSDGFTGDICVSARRKGVMPFLKRWLLIRLSIAGIGCEESFRFIWANRRRWKLKR